MFVLTMSNYSISDLEQLSGIKAHTIRMWERRYQIIEPQRTPTNIRFYSDEELKKLLNVALLVQNGHKISHVAEMNREQMNKEVLALSKQSEGSVIQSEQMLAAMLELNVRDFLSPINQAIKQLGFEATIETLIFPFLRRVGILWQTGSISQSHELFATQLIRQKIHEAIGEVASPPIPVSIRMVFFLPEGETSEIHLLYFALLALKSGIEVIYLGGAVPVNELIRMNAVKPIDVLFSSIGRTVSKENFLQLAEKIKTALPYTSLWVTNLPNNEWKSQANLYQSISHGAEFRNAVHDSFYQ